MKIHPSDNRAIDTRNPEGKSKRIIFGDTYFKFRLFHILNSWFSWGNNGFSFSKKVEVTLYLSAFSSTSFCHLPLSFMSFLVPMSRDLLHSENLCKTKENKRSRHWQILFFSASTLSSPLCRGSIKTWEILIAFSDQSCWFCFPFSWDCYWQYWDYFFFFCVILRLTSFPSSPESLHCRVEWHLYAGTREEHYSLGTLHQRALHQGN